MENIAILGSGTMGHSIALSAAMADYTVRVYGINEDDVANATKGLKGKVATLVANDVLTEQQGQEAIARIELSTHLEYVVKEATFVIEAIPENLALKQQTYAQLEQLIEPTAVIASNTSGIMPSLLAEKMSYPNRLVITHFYNPAHLVPLVEIVKGEKTDEATVERAMQLMQAFKKKPIKIEKEIAGFVGNRLQFALFREAQYLYNEGIATKEDIDAAVKYSIGRRLSVTGPLLSADMTGLDVVRDICNYLFADLSDEKQVGEQIESLVANNALGYKTGKGYYEWSESFSNEINAAREQTLIDHLKNDLQK